MYVVIGPDGKETAPVTLETLQAWVTRGQLPPHAIVIRPDGTRGECGQVPELMPYFPQAPSSAPFGGLIPTGNPKALTAYYLGYATLFPWLGLFVVPFVFSLAGKGIKFHQEHPEVKGRGHAITGIVFASVGLLINLPMWVLVIVAFTNPRR